MSPAPPPTPFVDEDSIELWTSLREGKLVLTHCQGCGTWLSRPQPHCNRCGAETAPDEISGGGAIYSFIVVHHPAVQAFAAMVPYVVALVELDEGPRIPGILLDESGPGVAIGQRVSAVLTTFTDAVDPAITFRRA